jgi:hypothetical protein
VLHRQALAYINMSREPQTLFKAARLVNCVRNSPLRGRLQSYVTLWRRNARRSCIIVNDTGSLCDAAQE